MSTLGASPHQQGHNEVITIRFAREELKEDDRRIADVLRMRMGLAVRVSTGVSLTMCLPPPPQAPQA
jgi:hypothetical protein